MTFDAGTTVALLRAVPEVSISSVNGHFGVSPDIVHAAVDPTTGRVHVVISDGRFSRGERLNVRIDLVRRPDDLDGSRAGGRRR